MLGKKINDPEITEMDDITWAWHFASWLEDRDEEIKKMRAMGCFIGSFTNPEAARKIQESEDGSNKVGLSEEEFDASSEYVRKSTEAKEKAKTGRKTKKRLRVNV